MSFNYDNVGQTDRAVPFLTCLIHATQFRDSNMKRTVAAAVSAATILGTAASAQTELSMWYHGAGNQVEGDLIRVIIDDFNSS